MPEPTGLKDASLFCNAKQERKSDVIECGVEVDDFRVLKRTSQARMYFHFCVSKLA